MLTIDLKAHHSGVAIALVDAFGSGMAVTAATAPPTATEVPTNVRRLTRNPSPSSTDLL
ncbi:hypothetical protein I551_7459 [Mycobacterium ulcerans str. Harvey]|uniref:Uncharacterized protein n=1 Tax=Mycobacterium ulcerans str. Harvey TaxID=1299332 RepID=A0ABP3A3L5_MYCUL|nr:hypothetical protein I551_7459 [Mycobacterium ulcerans str. Harvey]